ncbi:MAG: MBL fold metallo-hydrolase, partial [Chloroflexi bacterium]|nr:MBL fold metallo-hydrolase [Chloroflexota bacterium]
ALTDAHPALVRLSEHLYWFRDTCEVYLIKDGDRGLLIDAGSAAILDHLDEVGVREIEWVLHTHHHRDQCQGDDRLIAGGARVAVPAREAALFESVERFWQVRGQFDDYDASSLSNTRARSIPVARRLADYETFEWHGFVFRVQPTPGHTRGSVTYLAEIDGRANAFSGDVIAAPGHLDAIHDLQWQYATPDAIGAALHSVTRLGTIGPDRLLPSHGAPIDEPRPALASLAANLRELYRLTGEIRGNKVWTTWPHAVDQPKTHVLPHLWANTHSLANTYALIADDGDAMLLDYGFAAWDHFYADKRFVDHSLDELRDVAGLRRVTTVVPSHYHDDHLAGIPWLQRELGSEAWIFENFADIVEHPSAYALPCLLGDPIRVDRVIADGERVTWRDWSFDVFHMPGHTWWALGLAGEVDGTRVAFTGDNLLAGALSPLRTAAPIFRNRMRIDSIAAGVLRLMDYEPELLLTGHTGALPVTRAMLDDFVAWARTVEGVFRRLMVVPELVDEALDPRWAVIAPYRTTTTAPASVRLEVRLTNLRPEPAAALVAIDPPPGWTVMPERAEGPVESGAESVFAFELALPEETAAGRHVITADITFAGRRWGQLAEGWIDVIEATP